MINPGAAPNQNTGGPQSLQTLISQLLSGNYAPTGINMPSPSQNPSPPVSPMLGGQPGDPQQIWQFLQPLLQMFGGGGTSMTVPMGNSLHPGGNFLQSLFSSLLGPSALPTAGGAAPGAGSPQPAGAPAGQSGIMGGAPSSAGPTPQTP